MNEVRLHWFWRGLWAVVLASGINIVLSALAAKYLGPSAMGSTRCALMLASVWTVLPVVVHGLLTCWYGPRRVDDSETRCRQCGYILRGIPEPRCSECGEVI